MSLALVYWILMLLWLVGAAYTGVRTKSFVPSDLLLFLLLLCIGWSVYGAPVNE